VNDSNSNVDLRPINTNGQVPLPAANLDTEIRPINAHLPK
jgi:hypothetical protein